jgi:hypothetical protein
VSKTIRLVLFSLFILLFFSGCISNEVNENEDIFQFKNSYVGDAGAVGDITRRLPNPNGEQISGLELKTTEEPYGIILNYIATEKSDNTETNYKELVLYNTTFILTLVKNADWVKFNFISQEFKVSREEIKSFYERDIREFNNEEELSKFIQITLENENRVTQFFN